MIKFRKYSFLVALLFLQGCETLGPDLAKKRIIQPVESIPSQVQLNKNQSNGLARVQELPKAEIYSGNGFLINPEYKKSTQVASTEGKYTLNFSSAELSEVIKVILGDTLKYNFSISPSVKGKVTLQTSRALTREELLPTLQILLKMNNAVLIQNDDIYQVEPVNTALTGGHVPLFQKNSLDEAGVKIKIIPLKFIGVDDMERILAPVLNKKAVINKDVNRNLLFVVGNPLELANAQDLVNLFDVDVMRGQSVGLFPLMHVEPDIIQKELQEIFGSEPNSPLSGMLKMMPIERTNSLMVISPQQEYLKRVDEWIKRLDRTGESGQVGRVHVYQVHNVDAVELAGILEQIYPEQKSSNQKKRTGSVAPGLKPASIQSKSLANGGEKRKPDTVKTQVTSASKEATGPIRIIPDEANNALIIVASVQDYESLKKVIKQLDVTPLQVLIDATIVEVSLTDELHYGLQWFFTNKFGSHAGSGKVGSSNLSAAGIGGFSYSLVNSASTVRAELNALASDSKVNVLSTPSLMVLNNHEATIKVGDQVPIRTSESANTNSGTNAAIITSTIQMRDTGVTLTVKPRVNAGGLVIMEVEQNVDGVSRTESSEIDSPTIQQRQIKSSVAVQSGETIVLGGLITEQREQGKTGVPVLSRLPIVGGLFGRTDKVLDRTELVILLTPRVVRNQYDARVVTQEFKNKLTDIYTGIRENKKASGAIK